MGLGSGQGPVVGSKTPQGRRGPERPKGLDK